MSFIVRRMARQTLCAARRQQLQHVFRQFSASQGAIPAMMEKFKPLITPQLIHETGVSFVLDLTDSKWTLDLKESGLISEGALEGVDITLKMKDEVFYGLLDGSNNTATAYMTGQLKLKGNIAQAMKLSNVFKQMRDTINAEANK